MTWVRLDDRFCDHPKIAALSDKAFRAHISAICYAAGVLSDGVIPNKVAKHIAAPRTIAELERARLWARAVDGWEIHDFLDYHPPKEAVVAKRAADARRKRGGIRAESEIPAPTLVPDPEPRSKSADAVVDNRPSEDAIYLAGKIDETWGTDSLTAAALQKLINAYGKGPVTDSLRELSGFPPKVAIRSPYAYLESMCKAAVNG